MHGTRPKRKQAQIGEKRRLDAETQQERLDKELKAANEDSDNDMKEDDEGDMKYESEEESNNDSDDDFVAEDKHTDDDTDEDTDEDVKSPLQMRRIQPVLGPFAGAMELCKESIGDVLKLVVNPASWISRYLQCLADNRCLTHEKRFPPPSITKVVNKADLCLMAFKFLSMQPVQAAGMLSFRQFKELFDSIASQAENVACFLEEGMNVIFYSQWFPLDVRKPKFIMWADCNRNDEFLGNILLSCMVVGLYRPYFATSIHFEVADDLEEKRPPPPSALTIITEVYLLTDPKEAERLRAMLATTSHAFSEFLKANGSLQRDTQHMHNYLLDAQSKESCPALRCSEREERCIQVCKYIFCKVHAAGDFLDSIWKQLNRSRLILRSMIPPSPKTLQFLWILDDPIQVFGSSGTPGPSANLTVCMQFKGVSGCSFDIQHWGIPLWNAVKRAGHVMKTVVEDDMMVIKNKKIMSQREMRQEIGDMLNNLKTKALNKEVTVFYNGMPVKPGQVIDLLPTKRSILTVAPTEAEFLTKCLKQVSRGLRGTPTHISFDSQTHRDASSMGDEDVDDCCIGTKLAYGYGESTLKEECIARNLSLVYQRAIQGRSQKQWYKLGLKLCSPDTLLQFPANEQEHMSQTDRQMDGKIHDYALNYRLVTARLIAQKDSKWRLGHPFRKLPVSGGAPIFKRDVDNYRDQTLLYKHYKLACNMAWLLAELRKKQEYPVTFLKPKLALLAIHLAGKSCNPSLDWTRAVEELDQRRPPKSNAERFLEGI